MTIVDALIIIWCLFAALLTRRVYGRLLNSCFLMNLIWCVCSSLSSFGLFSFYKPSAKTKLYVLVFLIAFSIGSLLFNALLKRRMRIACPGKPEGNPGGNSPRDGQFRVNLGLLLLLLAAFALILSPAISKSLGYILAGDLKTMRNLFLKDAENYMGRITMFAYNYLIRPFFTFLNVLAAYAIGKNHKKKWKLLLLAVLGSAIHIVLSGGRMLLFELICYIVIALMLYRPKTGGASNRPKENAGIRFKIGRITIPISKRIRTWIFVLLPAGGIVAFVTSFRLYSGQGIIGTFWQYSIGPMGYLDLIVNQPLRFGISNDQLLFGKMTFGFLTGPLDTLASALFGVDYRGADYLASLYTERFFAISPTVNLNATSTILYPFLRDWGVAGLLIGPAIVAFFVEYVNCKALASGNVAAWNLLRISMYYMILFSVWRYTLLMPTTYMSFFWVAVLLFKNANSGE